MNTAITNGGFQCFADTPELVTFRAQIHGSSEIAALNLVQIIQEWVLSGPSINIKSQILNVKSSCPVLITALRENECVPSTMVTVIQTTLAISDEFISAAPGVINLTTIIIISLICVTIITLAITIAIIVYVRKRYGVSLRNKSDNKM